MHKELSIPKNPIIGNVFFRLGLIERYGTGVQRISTLYDNNANKPTFEVAENLIKITLPFLGSTTQEIVQTTQEIPQDLTDLYRSNDKMTDINRSNSKMTDIERKAKVIELFKTMDFVNNAIVRESIDFGEATIKRLLNEMVDEGTLRAEGENKGRKYYLVNKGD